MKPQDNVAQRGKTASMAWQPPLRWCQALQILALLLCLVVVLHACWSLWRAIDAHQLALAWQALHETTWRQLLLACLCVLLAYGAHIIAVLTIAEEVYLRLRTFSLEGRSQQTLRNAVRSAERHGVTFALLEDDEIARSIAALRRVSHAWLGARTERELGFSMGRFDPAYLRHFRVAAGRWHDALVAFVTV